MPHKWYHNKAHIKAQGSSQACQMEVQAFRSNVLLWVTFLESWDGTSMMVKQTWQEVRTHILTDVSESYGCEA